MKRKKIRKNLKEYFKTLASPKGTVTLAAAFLLSVFILLTYFCYPARNFLTSLFNGKDPDYFVTLRDGGDCYVSELRPLRAHFVDVGQGDAVFIEFPDGSNALVDSGARYANGNNLIKYLSDDLKIKKNNRVIATHPDADHIGNMPAVFKAFEVEKIYRPYVKSSYFACGFLGDVFNQGSYKSASEKYYDFLRAAFLEKVTVNGKELSAECEFFNCDSDFGANVIFNGKTYGYEFDFVTPSSRVDEIAYKNTNDYSPMAVIRYCGNSLLLTGDAASDGAEKEFYEIYNEKITVLKVAHHGSNTSTSGGFLKKYGFSYAVISCGADNAYGHPHREVLSRLYDNGVFLYRTDLFGNVVLTFTESGLYFSDVDLSKTENLYKAPEKLS